MGVEEDELEDFHLERENPWKVGMRRVLKVIDEENSKGFKAYYTGLYSTLPDILVIVKDNHKIVRVYEITNYSRKDEYIKPDRALRYRNTLNEFDNLERILVVSFKENLRYLPKNFFAKDGIKIRIEGEQD